jgi:hypothetical protein
MSRWSEIVGSDSRHIRNSNVGSNTEPPDDVAQTHEHASRSSHFAWENEGMRHSGHDPEDVRSSWGSCLSTSREWFDKISTSHWILHLIFSLLMEDWSSILIAAACSTSFTPTPRSAIVKSKNKVSSCKLLTYSYFHSRTGTFEVRVRSSLDGSFLRVFFGHHCIFVALKNDKYIIISFFSILAEDWSLRYAQIQCWISNPIADQRRWNVSSQCASLLLVSTERRFYQSYRACQRCTRKWSSRTSGTPRLWSARRTIHMQAPK